MPIPVPQAVSLFVAGALALLALALLLAARRRPPALVLGLLLALISLNFFANAAGYLSGNRAWHRLAYIALAMDPFFLAAFSRSYPYERWSVGHALLLGGSGILGAACLALVLVRPEAIVVTGYGASPRGFGNVLLVSNLAVGYTGAWLISVRATTEAPTAGLARQAGWLTFAVGMTVLPRLALVVHDVRFASWLAETSSWSAGLQMAVVISMEGSIALIALVAAAVIARKSRTAFKATAAAGAAAALFLLASTPLYFVPFSLTYAYSARWIPFALVLVHGLVVHGVAEFHRAADVTLAAIGGALGSWTTLLIALVVLGPGSEVAAFAVALAAAVPSAVATRWLVRRLFGTAPSAADSRRLELYRAAVAARATEEGVPASARRDLDAERRRLGVSVEEARALEHAVRPVSSGSLRAGDEPVPGLVVETFLAEGAHGRVFAARRHTSGKEVVLKELKPARDAQHRERLWAEFASLRQLTDPRVVRLLDVHVVNGSTFLELERVAGQSLEEVLAQEGGHPSPVDLADDLLGALEVAHARGIVHGDVKPANVLVRPRGSAVLTDFGISSIRDLRASPHDTASAFDQTLELRGTLGYLAPEQVRGERSPRSDLYAAGLVIYEALARRPALDIEGFAPYEALERVANPTIDLDAVPPHWRPFLRRALAPSPSDRYRSAAEMRSALPRDVTRPGT